MPAKPVILSNGRHWPLQGDAEKHFRDIRDKYGRGKQVTDPQDIDDLLALLQRYDTGWTGTLKAGKPISHFTVEVNIGHPGFNTCFFIYYQDGTKDDFSFKEAVKGPRKIA